MISITWKKKDKNDYAQSISGNIIRLTSAADSVTVGARPVWLSPLCAALGRGVAGAVAAGGGAAAVVRETVEEEGKHVYFR